MTKRRIFYLFLTIAFIFLAFYLLSVTDLKDNFAVCKTIQIIIILYLIRISYGCTIYIRKLYAEKKYSYSIIMNLGLLIFLNLNILRHVDLLISNWNQASMSLIFLHTLQSFSYFSMLILPFIVLLSIYGIIANVVLILKEGFHPRKLLCVFLGIFAILGLFGNQAIYFFTSKMLLGSQYYSWKLFFDLFLNSFLSYFYTLMLATLYCNIRAAKHIPSYDQDFVIILGSKVASDGGLTPLLKGRADKALEFGKKQFDATRKKIYYIPSGGKGLDEKVSEATAIKNYLLKNGVENSRILLENHSTSTIENMRFSKEKIDSIQKDANVCFATTNYHVFRSGVIASNEGLDCEGMGSKTKWYFYSNALTREFIANIVQEWKRHFFIILIMIITLYILLEIGIFYHLI